MQAAYNNGSGVLLVAAAGNDGNANLNYPAAYPEVVSVAATDNRDHRASFSNANSDVEVAAIADLNPTANAATLRSKLDAAVDDIGPAGRDPSFGYGRVNLCKAAGGACAYTGGG